MKKEDIQPWDMQRILFGQAPAEFLLEVFLRTIFIYLLLMVVLRILGKRMDGQLTLTEMAVMITFGAIVAVPMQIPDRGVLLGVIALLCVMAFQRGVNWLNVKNEKLEKVTQGSMTTLVKDGIMQLAEMRATGVSKQHLFAALRGKKILNLGKIKRVYFEACGLMNVYEQDGAGKPGLPVLPSEEMDLMISETKVDNDHVACTNCGNVSDNAETTCSECGEKKWMKAVI
jgi:uncharacterized membrane protein YcaP (DUF421 family)